MAIIITGTPGTGKTTLAAELEEQLGRPTINITTLLEQHNMDSEWDEQRKCFLVDVLQLTDLLERIVKGDADIIIEGHLSHYLSPDHVERCIVTKCELPELKRRLEERGYEEQKVRENLDCEIFDVCYVEALEQGHEPEVHWTSDQPSNVSS